MSFLMAFNSSAIPLLRDLCSSGTRFSTFYGCTSPVARVACLDRRFNSSLREATNKTDFYMRVKKLPDFDSTSISTPALLEAIRDMQSYRGITDSGSTHVPEFKGALKSLTLLAVDDKRELSLKEIESVLHTENGVTWRLVHDLVETGQVPELARLDGERRAAFKFNRIHGIGKVFAMTYAKNGARTLDYLIASEDTQYGKKVSPAQKLALTYASDMDALMPRAEIDEYKKIIHDALAAAESYKFEIMGSYRRGAELSSDIDLVVTHPSLQIRDREGKVDKKKPDAESLIGKVHTALIEAKILEADKIFSFGHKKILALTKLPSSPIYRQIDVRLCPLQSLPYMLVGNTGDDILMKRLRVKASMKSWVLNVYEMGPRTRNVGGVMVRPGQEIMVKTEEEIFKLLGVPYLPPTKRSYKTYSKISGYKTW